MNVRISIGEFFAACRARGPMTLKDHLNATDFPDHASARYMRNRALIGMKGKYAELVGTIVLNDGSRSDVFAEHEATESTLPVPVRPASLEVEPLNQLRAANSFALPSTDTSLANASNALIGLPRSRQEAVVAGFKSYDDERAVALSAKTAAEMRANDLFEQLQETRRDKAWMQQMMLAGVSPPTGGRAVTR